MRMRLQLRGLSLRFSPCMGMRLQLRGLSLRFSPCMGMRLQLRGLSLRFSPCMGMRLQLRGLSLRFYSSHGNETTVTWPQSQVLSLHGNEPILYTASFTGYPLHGYQTRFQGIPYRIAYIGGCAYNKHPIYFHCAYSCKHSQSTFNLVVESLEFGNCTLGFFEAEVCESHSQVLSASFPGSPT